MIVSKIILYVFPINEGIISWPGKKVWGGNLSKLNALMTVIWQHYCGGVLKRVLNFIPTESVIIEFMGIFKS